MLKINFNDPRGAGDDSMRNRVALFINRFSLNYPIIVQAPMAGGITTPDLVASVSNVNALGSFAIGTATSLEEAKILEHAGIDAIVAQGYEAGGHRGGFFTPFKRSIVGTMALIPRLVDEIDLPIIAAGGIMDGRGIVAATALGACGAQMGTAFLCTKESGANETYQKELLKLKTFEHDVTTLTDVYSGKWARGIKTEFVEYMERQNLITPEYPIPNTLTSEMRKVAAKKKLPHLMSMWSGQGAPLMTSALSANTLITKLRTEIEESLKKLSIENKPNFSN